MWTSGNVLTKPGSADIKASKVVYEETYQPGEKLDDILGTTF